MPPAPMDDTQNPKLSSTNQKQLTCPSCTGNLVYAPGSQTVRCEHCGAEVEIAEMPENSIEELSFDDHISQNLGNAEMQTLHTVRCTSCGAHVSLAENVTSDRCPFCSSILVVTDTISETQIKPGLLLPFDLDGKAASERFKRWIASLWFAPSKLKTLATPNAITGIYIPYWTFDANTYTTYSGQRGDNYTTTIPVVRNGRTEHQTVTRTRWRGVSGAVDVPFDDMLVTASHTLTQKEANALEPWDLERAMAYNEMYLSGYRTEAYQVDLQQGLELAKQRMEAVIRSEICRDIGGDHQRIHHHSTNYSDITFKHALLPVYISSFKYKNKVFRFLINARTGRVHGQRPYSALKIMGAIILGAAVGWLLWYISGL